MPTWAALPPQYQNMKDIDSIIDFVKQHKRILNTLEMIDFENNVVYYNHGCIANLGRQGIMRPQGWVGPADPLELKKSTCPIE